MVAHRANGRIRGKTDVSPAIRGDSVDNSGIYKAPLAVAGYAPAVFVERVAPLQEFPSTR
jgi:hypothetical protein